MSQKPELKADTTAILDFALQGKELPPHLKKRLSPGTTSSAVRYSLEESFLGGSAGSQPKIGHKAFGDYGDDVDDVESPTAAW